MRVTRGSSGLAHCALGSATLIVRSLKSVSGGPPRRCALCLKKTGPPSSLIASALRAMSGAVATTARCETTMSTARFDAGATVRNFGCMMYWNQAALISADRDVAEDLLVERGQLPQPHRQVEAGRDLLEDAEAGGLARQDEQVDAARLDHLGKTAERAERRHLAVHARRALGQRDPTNHRVARDAHQGQLAGDVRGGPLRADDRRAERPLTPPADVGQVGGDRRRGGRERDDHELDPPRGRAGPSRR